MCGPGEYRPDPTESMTRVEALPPPHLVRRRRNAKRHPCPQCGHQADRDKHQHRTLHDLGDLSAGRPQDLHVTSAQYSCTPCRRSCTTDLSDLAPSTSQYTPSVIDIAVRIVVEDGLPSRSARWHLWREHRVFVPFATIQNGGEAGGKKGRVAYGHGLPRLGVG